MTWGSHNTFSLIFCQPSHLPDKYFLGQRKILYSFCMMFSCTKEKCRSNRLIVSNRQLSKKSLRTEGLSHVIPGGFVAPGVSPLQTSEEGHVTRAYLLLFSYKSVIWKVWPKNKQKIITSCLIQDYICRSRKWWDPHKGMKSENIRKLSSIINMRQKKRSETGKRSEWSELTSHSHVD